MPVNLHNIRLSFIAVSDYFLNNKFISIIARYCQSAVSLAVVPPLLPPASVDRTTRLLVQTAGPDWHPSSKVRRPYHHREPEGPIETRSSTRPWTFSVCPSFSAYTFFSSPRPTTVHGCYYPNDGLVHTRSIPSREVYHGMPTNITLAKGKARIVAGHPVSAILLRLGKGAMGRRICCCCCQDGDDDCDNNSADG
jgi:hypothetical protein